MLFLLSFLFVFPAAAAQLVTETVGQVADHVVTSREVQIANAAETVLFSGNASGSANFRVAVSHVLREMVIALEAENFNIAEVSNEDVLAAVAKLEKAMQGKTSWAALEVTNAELRRIVRVKLMAKSFFKFKTSSMAGIITDQEALDYYNKNRAKFGSTPFESFKENIKSFLSQQQLEERVRAWFDIIKRKYKARSFLVE